jgi:hypothetical protein
MKGRLSRASRMFRRAVKQLRFEGVGFTIPPFTASFTVRCRRRKVIAIRPQRTLALTNSSIPFDTVLDTVEIITDTERKRAMRKGDWVTAIGAAYIQDYVRQTRRKGD